MDVKNLSQDSQCSSQDSHWTPPQYKSRSLLLHPSASSHACQKTRKTEIWSHLSATLFGEPHVLEKIVVDGVMWVFRYKPEMMHRSFQWKVSSFLRLIKICISKQTRSSEKSNCLLSFHTAWTECKTMPLIVLCCSGNAFTKPLPSNERLDILCWAFI